MYGFYHVADAGSGLVFYLFFYHKDQVPAGFVAENTVYRISCYAFSFYVRVSNDVAAYYGSAFVLFFHCYKKRGLAVFSLSFNVFYQLYVIVDAAFRA